MAHFAFTHKESGEVRFSEADLDPDHWDKSAALPRRPGEHDDFVDGKLVKNKDREAKSKRASRANGMRREEMLEMIEDLQLRLAALEAKQHV